LGWVYVLGCELIVHDPMPFNNCNFCFISQKTPPKKEETKVMLKKKEKIVEKKRKEND